MSSAEVARGESKVDVELARRVPDKALSTESGSEMFLGEVEGEEALAKAIGG